MRNFSKNVWQRPTHLTKFGFWLFWPFVARFSRLWILTFGIGRFLPLIARFYRVVFCNLVSEILKFGTWLCSPFAAFRPVSQGAQAAAEGVADISSHGGRRWSALIDT